MSTVTLSLGPRTLACGCPEYSAVANRRGPRLTARKRARLLREAQATLAPFGLDWTRYAAPVIGGYDDCPHQSGIVLSVRWALRAAPREGIVLSNIWWDERTGAILQCGCHYGSLEF